MFDTNGGPRRNANRTRWIIAQITTMMRTTRMASGFAAAPNAEAYLKPEAEMRRLFPRTRLVTIKGAGHWVHSEQPASFVSALRVFLTA